MDIIFDCKLASDRLSLLKEMSIRMKWTMGCKVIDVVAIDEMGRTRTVMVGKK